MRRTDGAVAVALSAAALAMGSYATLAFAPIAPIVRADLGLSRAEIGALTALIFGGAALSSAPGGKLTDRYGAPRVLAAAMAGVSAATLLVAAAPVALLFMAGALLIGLAYGLITPPTNVIVRGSGASRHGGLLMSIKQTGVTLGGVVSGTTLPTLAQATSWRLALLAPATAAAAVSAAAIAMRRLLWRQTTPAAGNEADDGSGPTRRWLLATRTFGFLMAGLQVGFATYIAVYLVEEHGYGITVAGLAVALGMAAGTAGRLGWAVLSDRRYADRREVGLRLNAYVGLVGLACLAFVPTGPLVWVCIAVIGASSIGWNGVYMALVAESVPAARVGRASGAALQTIFAGVVVIPPTLGLVADHAGWPAAWLTACGLAAVAAASLTLARGTD